MFAAILGSNLLCARTKEIWSILHKPLGSYDSINNRLFQKKYNTPALYQLVHGLLQFEFLLVISLNRRRKNAAYKKLDSNVSFNQ